MVLIPQLHSGKIREQRRTAANKMEPTETITIERSADETARDEYA
jgi:hypothetical protein